MPIYTEIIKNNWHFSVKSSWYYTVEKNSIAEFVSITGIVNKIISIYINASQWISLYYFDMLK